MKWPPFCFSQAVFPLFKPEISFKFSRRKFANLFLSGQNVFVDGALILSCWRYTKVGGWIGVYRSAQIWSKIRDPTMVLSKLESTTSSNMKLQSRIWTKLQAKSTIGAKILDKSAVLTNLCKIHQIRNPNNFFCEIRRSENLLTPPPPRQLPTYAKTVYWLFFLPVLF
jgi:hypothetical protein